MEAVVNQARTTGHPWLVACDANMNQEDLKKNLWSKEKYMFIGDNFYFLIHRASCLRERVITYC